MALVDRLERLHEFHLHLSGARTEEDLCRMVVDEGRECLGVDRIGIWFLDGSETDWFRGSFGIDESGNLRDERGARIPRDPAIYDDSFFTREVPVRHWDDSPIYNDRQEVVGRGHLCVTPIWNGTSTIGTLSVDNFLSGHPLTGEDMQLISLLGRIVGHLVHIRRTEERLRDSARALERAASTDELTGLFNRGAGMVMLRREMLAADRVGYFLTVCFLDLDGLKLINDTHGHAAGDRFIQNMADALLETIRETDIAARMGGDEFMLVLPDTTAEAASGLLQRVGEAFLARMDDPGPDGIVPFSYGLSTHRPAPTSGKEHGPGPDVDHLVESILQDADTRMYAMKRAHHRGEAS